MRSSIKLCNVIFSLNAFIVLFSVPLFFTVASFFGYTHRADDPGSAYVIFISSVFFIQLIYYLYSVVVNGVKRIEIYFLLGIFLIISWSFAVSIFNEFHFKNLIIFIIMGLPGYFLYFSFSKGNFANEFFKRLEAVVIAFCVFFIITVQRMLVSADTFADVGLAGATYQTLSYTAVLLFGIVYQYLVDSKSVGIKRITIFLLYITLLVCLVLIAILGGSKGAFLVLFAYLIMIFHRSGFILFIALLALISILMSIALSLLEVDHDFSMLEVGMSRISMLFDSSLSLADRSSGRDEYYLEFLKLLDAQPLFGYGIMSENPYVTNTHNLFLMFILQNGFIVGCLISIAYLFFLFRVFQLEKLSGNNFHLIIIINVFIMLMFSGQFFANCLFWFTLAYMVDKSGFLRPSCYEKSK